MSVIIYIEKFKGVFQFLSRVFLTHFSYHYIEELVEIYSALTGLVKITNQVFDLIFGWFESQSSEGHFKLLGLYGSRTTSVEQIEGFFNFLFLRIAQLLSAWVLLLLFLWFAVCFRHFD